MENGELPGGPHLHAEGGGRHARGRQLALPAHLAVRLAIGVRRAAALLIPLHFHPAGQRAGRAEAEEPGGRGEAANARGEGPDPAGNTENTAGPRVPAVRRTRGKDFDADRFLVILLYEYREITMLRISMCAVYHLLEDLSALPGSSDVFTLQKSQYLTLQDEYEPGPSSAVILGNNQILHINCNGKRLLTDFSGQVQDIQLILQNCVDYSFASTLLNALFQNVQILTDSASIFGYSRQSKLRDCAFGSFQAQSKVFEFTVIQSELSRIIASDMQIAQQLTDNQLLDVVSSKDADTFQVNNVQNYYCVVQSANCQLLAASVSFGKPAGGNLVFTQQAGNYQVRLNIQSGQCKASQLLVDSACKAQACFSDNKNCNDKAQCIDLKCKGCAFKYCEGISLSLVFLIIFVIIFITETAFIAVCWWKAQKQKKIKKEDPLCEVKASTMEVTLQNAKESTYM